VSHALGAVQESLRELGKADACVQLYLNLAAVPIDACRANHFEHRRVVVEEALLASRAAGDAVAEAALRKHNAA